MTYKMSCAMGGGRLTAQGTFTRLGPDAVQVHSISPMEGGQINVPDMDMTVTSHRLGPCQLGDKPDLN